MYWLTNIFGDDFAFLIDHLLLQGTYLTVLVGGKTFSFIFVYWALIRILLYRFHFLHSVLLYIRELTCVCDTSTFTLSHVWVNVCMYICIYERILYRCATHPDINCLYAGASVVFYVYNTTMPRHIRTTKATYR